MDCNRRLVLTPEQLEEPCLAVQAGMMGELDQAVSEDLDHGALTMDISQAYKSDCLAQELHSKLGSADAPLGWEWSEGQLRFQGCLYIPNQEILHLQVIHNFHNHPSTGHFREARTSDLICWNFHWPGLCKPYGKLKQLPIPSRPWSSISMDFIEQLPASKGFSAILIVVN